MRVYVREDARGGVFFFVFRSMGVRVCALWGHGRQAHVDDVSYRARSRHRWCVSLLGFVGVVYGVRRVWFVSVWRVVTRGSRVVSFTPKP